MDAKGVYPWMTQTEVSATISTSTNIPAEAKASQVQVPTKKRASKETKNPRADKHRA
jgi:hypothetical protein